MNDGAEAQELPPVDPVSLYFQEIKAETEAAFTDDVARLANKIIHRIQQQRKMADSTIIGLFDGLYRLQFKGGARLSGQGGEHIVLHSVTQLEQFLCGYPLGPNWQTTLAKADRAAKRFAKERKSWRAFGVKGEPVLCEDDHLIGVLSTGVPTREDMGDTVIAPSYTMMGLETEQDCCWCGKPYCRRPQVILLEGPTQVEWRISHEWR